MFSGALAWNSLGTSCTNTHLHSFLIRLAAFLVIFFGNSIMSMPLRMMLYVFMGSGPEKGGLQNIRQTHQLSLKCICGHCVVKTSAQLAFINHLRNLFSFTHTHSGTFIDICFRRQCKYRVQLGNENEFLRTCLDLCVPAS